MAQQQQLMQQQFMMAIMVMMSRRNLSAFPPTISQIHIITILVKVNMRKGKGWEGRGEVYSIIDVCLLFMIED